MEISMEITQEKTMETTMEITQEKTMETTTETIQEEMRDMIAEKKRFYLSVFFNIIKIKLFHFYLNITNNLKYY